MGCCQKPIGPIKPPKQDDPNKTTKQSQQSEVKFQPGKLFCPHQHQIVKMCISKQCKADALSCSHPFCPVCNKLHPGCKHIPLTQLTEMIRKRVGFHHQLMKKMRQVQIKMVHKMVAKRKESFSNLFTQGLSQRYVSIIDTIYYKQSETIIQGKQALEFCVKLDESNELIPKLQENLMQKYEQELETQVQSLERIQANIIDQYAFKCKIQFKDNATLSQKVLKPKQSKATICDIDSKILEQDLDALAFACDALNWPTKLQLVFRASEHDFKASAFHEKCDEITHTFTIIKTQFDKIIGGYTPLKWNIVQGFAEDKSEESFLLSISLRQKMELIRPDKAIQCIPSYGPVFGGGADLAVSDKCNVNNNSCTNFSYSYNYKDKYQYGQEAWTALCGTTSGKYFKVVQYEVYKVVP